MIDLEQWVIHVLDGIKSANDSGASEYKLILDKEEIKIITESYEDTSWIEIIGGEDNGSDIFLSERKNRSC